LTANASVALLYYADEPNGMSPVSARLGGPKAGGWTADQALENLARVIPDVGLPDFLPTAARADVAARRSERTRGVRLERAAAGNPA